MAGLAGPSGAGVEGGGLGAATARASHRCMAWARGLMQSPAPGVRGWGGRASWVHRGLFFPTHLVPSSCPRAGFRASQRARHRVERSPLAKPRTAGCGWRLLGAMAELGVGAPPAVPPPPLRQPLGRTSGRGRHGAIDREEATSESRKLYKSAADRTGPHLRRCSNESETRAMLIIFILPLATTLRCTVVR